MGHDVELWREQTVALVCEVVVYATVAKAFVLIAFFVEEARHFLVGRCFHKLAVGEFHENYGDSWRADAAQRTACRFAVCAQSVAAAYAARGDVLLRGKQSGEMRVGFCNRAVGIFQP